MPWHKIPNTDTCYALVCFDEDGAERSDDRDALGRRFSEKVIEQVRANPPTDIFMFSHGWKGDVHAAVGQYDKWIGALKTGGRGILVSRVEVQCRIPGDVSKANLTASGVELP